MQQRNIDLSGLLMSQKNYYVSELLRLLLSKTGISYDDLIRFYSAYARLEYPQEKRIDADKAAFLQSPYQFPPSDSLPDDARYCLTRDLMAISGAKSAEDFEQKIPKATFEMLRLGKEILGFLAEWTLWENKIMERIGRGDLKINKADVPVELVKKGTALGVPIGILYFSGVVGFSAAGITSGLASIGTVSMLTALGLNPMTAGIAALIVSGILIKKVLDAMLPTAERDQNQKSLIEEQKRILQKTRQYLISDRDIIIEPSDEESVEVFRKRIGVAKVFNKALEIVKE